MSSKSEERAWEVWVFGAAFAALFFFFARMHATPEPARAVPANEIASISR